MTDCLPEKDCITMQHNVRVPTVDRSGINFRGETIRHITLLQGL
jgi:hypothetical protein